MKASLLVGLCAGFDPALPVFVEAESKKIGNLRVPRNADRGHVGKHVRKKLDASIDLRVADAPSTNTGTSSPTRARLGVAARLPDGASTGEQQILRLEDARRARRVGMRWCRELLEMHYDPGLYLRQHQALSAAPQAGTALTVTANSDREFERLAAQCLGRHLQAIARPLILARYVEPGRRRFGL